MNPWGVTPGEAATMDLWLQHCSAKGCARASGKHAKTHEAQKRSASARMRQADPELRHTLHCLLAWHDWRKANPAPASAAGATHA